MGQDGFVHPSRGCWGLRIGVGQFWLVNFCFDAPLRVGRGHRLSRSKTMAAMPPGQWCLKFISLHSGAALLPIGRDCRIAI